MAEGAESQHGYDQAASEFGGQSLIPRELGFLAMRLGQIEFSKEAGAVAELGAGAPVVCLQGVYQL